MQTDYIKSIEKTNYQFNQINQLTNVIVNGSYSSLLICGRGGLGKTYTVNKTLKDLNLIEGQDYYSYTGSCTPKALYQKLYDHNNKILLFDDCDEFLMEKKAINILKGALDTSDIRTVSWLIASKLDKNYPDKFIFNGKIIFISNLSLEDIDEALKTRIMMFEVKLENIDILNRIYELKNIICKEHNIDDNIFYSCYWILNSNLENLNKINKMLSMRDLVKIINIKKQIIDDSWIQLATSTLLIK